MGQCNVRCPYLGAQQVEQSGHRRRVHRRRHRVAEEVSEQRLHLGQRHLVAAGEREPVEVACGHRRREESAQCADEGRCTATWADGYGWVVQGVWPSV